MQVVGKRWREMELLAIARLYRFSALELGFTKQHLGLSLKAIALPTLASALLMFIYYMMQGPRIDNSAYKWTFYLFFVGVRTYALTETVRYDMTFLAS